MSKSRARSLPLAVTTAFAAIGLAASVSAHEGHTGPGARLGAPLPGGAILQLEAARQATGRFHDVAEAEAEGYVDIGLFIPNMGWHYLKADLLNRPFDPAAPELLVYADDPCGGPRRLVAVEYAVPLAISKNAPAGFAGNADVWEINADFQLWTLHAWVWEYNPDGVFAAFNPRVQ